MSTTEPELSLEERIARLEKSGIVRAGVGSLPPEGVSRQLGGIVARSGSECAWLGGKDVGVGSTVDSSGVVHLDVEVARYLALGSPRLALATALGVRLNPFVFNVRADFTSTDTSLVPDVGSDVKISQDTEVESIVTRITNQSNVANLSVFQPQSDYFYSFQSGLEAILAVQGAPRYDVAPKYTKLSTLFDVAVGNAHWPRGWILTYQQQVFMSFRTTVSLPFAPIEVDVTFRCRIPSGEAFVELTNREAISSLASLCGIVVTDAYRDRMVSGLVSFRGS